MNKLITVILGTFGLVSVSYCFLSKKLFDFMFLGHQDAIGAPDLNVEDYLLLKDSADKWYQSIEKEEVEIESYDHTILKGEILVHPDCNKWIILVHAYRCSRELMLPHAMNFYQAGYNVLLFDHRGHGASEGKYISMGWLEQQDVIHWIQCILSRDNNASIGLLGISMGGATVMNVSGNNLPNNIKCIISDSGCGGVGDIFLEHMENSLGFSSKKLLLTFQKICSKKLGFDIFEKKPQIQLEKSSTPILFIHGDEDTFVSIDNVYHFCEACSSEHELYITKGRDHALTILDDQYFSKIHSFINKYM